MSDNAINTASEYIVKSTIALTPDIDVVSREERFSHTPNSNGEWITVIGTKSTRGVGNFYPTDNNRVQLLSKYGQDHIHYNHNGEPDFSPFAVAKIKTSAMQGGNQSSRNHNYTVANKKLLETDWAKEQNLTTLSDIKRYCKENHLTWHESQDGITMQLIPTEINSSFGHSGGVSTLKHLNDEITTLKDSGKLIGKASVKIARTGVKITEDVNAGLNKSSEFISQQTNIFLKDDITKRINSCGMESAVHAATFAAAMSAARNTLEVIRGDSEINDAAKKILVDTASAAALGYASGALTEALGIGHSEASLLINGTIQVSKQIIAYGNGELTEEQLLKNTAETAVYLAAAYAGKMIGQTIGSAAGPVGTFIGGIIGEMLTTAICSEVISTIEFKKDFDKNINHIRSLYHNAEAEIRRSQARLEEIINRENQELQKAVTAGLDTICHSIYADSPEQFDTGLLMIGEKFGITKEYLDADEITLDNLFLDSDQIIVLR